MIELVQIPNTRDADRDKPYESRKVVDEFSPCNHLILKQALEETPECKVILEIGVARNNNKPKDTYYLGIDLNDKSFLDNPVNKVYTLKISSSNYKEIMKYITSTFGTDVIDFIHIDGWHSVNQILDDWKFVNNLSKQGTVALHDTNVHPGPVHLIKAIDKTKFDVRKKCVGIDDWGITIVKRKY